MANSDWIVVARLIRPRGRSGELMAEILTDFPERFHARQRLFLLPPARIGTRPREIVVENFWFQRSRLVFKFHGVDSINEAEALRGFEVAVPASERMPVEADRFYISDLIGCRLIDLNQKNQDAGEIVDLDRQLSSTDLLVVRRAGARGSDAEVLVPFVRAYLVKVDLTARRVEMRLPAGLLEVNAPMTAEEKAELQSEADADRDPDPDPDPE